MSAGQERESFLPDPLFTKEGRSLYPLRAVAAHLDRSHVTLLETILKANLTAIKPGIEWFVCLDELIAYREQPGKTRRPGRHRANYKDSQSN
ncbi:hypothetical protein A2870_01045 [Candidatus Curtissbacteria bacterium RIFCSPHIGHO2_01_FULL_41_11]|uniref:KilA-N DNA-binding domain-containing protein n=1 Tax=Candidatus Curtissbacteria bacterium RIFCSPHIGHO2_01_FULL_41_11 TaxID=1797711 RepID=A0A1F5G3J6_9BACT|nr:MAG: hypothetical protein A2870_01045 [Candidatus Curtissbacteria bacterium RIFCSPHIGHO2_01_FULL_41_11]